MEQIILDDGGNDYNIPHLGKDKMRRDNGRLPRSLPVGEAAKEKLREMGLIA